jgi:putative chitinase
MGMSKPIDAQRFEQSDLAELLAPQTAQRWYLPLLEAFRGGRVTTAKRQAHFLAQACHESMGLLVLEENLNYSAERLLKIFPKYFPSPVIANNYARNPQAIANKAYGHRLGRGEYARLERELGLPLVQKPELLLEPSVAAKAAVNFWVNRRHFIGPVPHRGLNILADRDDVRAVTRAINGGQNGLEDRILWLQRWKQALGVNSGA